MRKSMVEASALAALLLGAALVWGQPPAAPPAADKDKKDQAAKSKLEEMLQKALQDNPDVRLAEVKVAEADAELNRARLLVVRKVGALYQALEAQKAAVEGAAAELEETKTLFKSGAAPQGTLRDAEQKLLDAKAKLAMLEAEMPYLLGQQPAGEAARDDASKAPKKTDAGDADLAAARVEVEKRRAESEKTRALLDEEAARNRLLEKDLAKEHEEMVAWKIRADTAELRRNELEKENEQLARDNQKLLAGDAKKETPSNPPADLVEGVVVEVAAGGLVRITLVSDAGPAKGNTLEVYRLDKDPKQSKYLGRIKIVDVAAKEAVGQLLGKPAAALQTGDRVYSRLLDK